jgi:hypothetical protein
VDGPHIQEPVTLRGFAGTPDVLERHDLTEVEERSSDGCDWDAIDLGAVVRVELPYRMNRDPGPAATTGTRYRDVDRRAIGLPEIPEIGGISMAEEGALAAGKYGGHPIALAAEGPDGVDASMHTAKSRIRNPLIDCGLTDSQCH